MNMLAKITNSAQKAGELAQQLLAFARGGKYHPRVVNLNDIIRQTLRLHSRSVPMLIRIVEDLQADLWSIEADRAQISQVVMSLCMNAVEAISGPGVVTVTTRNIEVTPDAPAPLSSLKPGPHVEMTVHDTGHGVAEDVRARIFEPFFTTKFQGRGLGLAAAYGIVQNHHGLITVESAEGEGATFRVCLPAVPAQAPPEPDADEDTPTGHETLLLADDEETVLSTTRDILEHLGYTVITACNGAEAVRAARLHQGPIQLAILDLAMPVMDGAEAFHKLVKTRPDMKIIVCSGYELDEAAQAILDDGAAAFLQKPFRVSALARAIRAALKA
ncbi:MAG TPA: response regulator, partial [Candidatus Brocadiia bacterium]|nr:response regulator [Candidatus Brocadiia bacterium]